MIRVKIVVLILPVLCLVFAACGGSAIGDAQEFSPNEAPSILSIKAVNLDGSEIKQLDIEPYKQFKLIVEATDPDNNPLQYKFDSESGTFAGITANSTGCTAIFKTGRVVGGQNVEFWAGVSDGKGALVRQSYNLGTGKSGPTLVAILEKIRFRPEDKVKLSVTANCSGFFQFYSNGNNETEFKFENDMFRYSYSENKTTELILGGPKCASFADIQLEPRADGIYGNDPNYNIVLVFRDGLFQTSRFIQEICVDEENPVVDGFSPVENANLTQTFAVTFSENIGYADSSCLKLDKAGSVKLLKISENIVEFSVSGLKALTPYIATISGIKDIAGNEMLPDSTKSFMTKYGGSSKFVVYDINEGKSCTSYRGFENKDLNLTSNYDDVIKYESSDTGLVVIDQNNLGKITVKTHDYALADINLNTDKTITIKATRNNGETADFIVTVKPWYPVIEAEDFGQDGNIRKNLNGRFRLMNVIDFSGVMVSPIGAFSSAPFTGVFDGNNGNNYKLLNLKIKTNANYAGLFAYNTGTIQNLTVDSASVETNAYNYIGILCGYNKGKKESGVYVEGIIKSCHVIKSTVNGKDYIGGIAGCSSGVLYDCSIKESSVTAAACVNGKTGGIVGHNYGDVIVSKNEDTEVNGLQSVGGLIGYAEKSANDFTIFGCSSNGEVKGSNNVGGLVGLLANGNIYDCHSTGNVAADSANCVGGLVGYLKAGNVENSEHTIGSVKGSQNVGGLIGQIYGSATVTGCYNQDGVVQGTSNVGGLIGYIQTAPGNNVNITGSYAKFNEIDQIKDVIAVNYAGGLIGKVEDNGTFDILVKINSCYAIGEVEYDGPNETNRLYFGGLIGHYTFTASPGNAAISRCFASGKVVAWSQIGGLIAYMKNCQIENCYSASTVYPYASNATNFGGLVGEMDTGCKISCCYAVGDVDTKGTSRGGLVGKNSSGDGSVNDSFWKKETSSSGNNPDNGIGDPKTDEELSNISTYSTPPWSISANKEDDVIWIMPDGVNIVYPCENPFRFNSSALSYSFPYLKNLPYPPQ